MLSLHMFLQVYFPDSTGLTPFSADHIKMIDRLEETLLTGGRTLNAVYRGFSKTTITENAAIWATLKGIRSFVAMYGADQTAANSMIESITTELCENELLIEDFPEICGFFEALDGKAQRCRAQTFNGRPTHIRMAAEYLVFPTIKLCDKNGDIYTPKACGSIMRAKGLLSASRGMSYKQPGGAKIRPDFALIDDFQTDKSAKQPGQVDTRLNIIRKAILKSSGHRKSIACAINATVIELDDAVDQLLDPELNPSWDGMRVPMVYAWSKSHETLWEKYRSIRHTYDRTVKGDKERARQAATDFYAANQKEMDDGCIVGWKSCFDPELELSAIQHAYNFYVDDTPEVFASECQNQPLRISNSAIDIRTPTDILKQLSGFRKGVVPNSAAHVTGFCDVHDDVLYWMVCAFDSNFTGYTIDYGTYPEQTMAYFMKSQSTKTLRRRFPGIGKEAAIVAGLEEVVNSLCEKEWYREDGTPIQIGRFHVDRGYVPDQVEIVCRRSAHAAVLQPQLGRGIRPTQVPIEQMDRKKTYRRGDHWYEPKSQRRTLRYAIADVNYWKVFFHARLSTGVGSPGSMSLYSPTKKERDHRMIADHWTAEVPTETSGNGRTVFEWTCPPSKDNHWFDCVIGCMIAASMLGVTVAGAPAKNDREKRGRPRVRISDIRRT